METGHTNSFGNNANLHPNKDARGTHFMPQTGLTLRENFKVLQPQ